jgi:hypothetical protein
MISRKLIAFALVGFASASLALANGCGSDTPSDVAGTDDGGDGSLDDGSSGGIDSTIGNGDTGVGGDTGTGGDTSSGGDGSGGDGGGGDGSNVDSAGVVGNDGGWNGGGGDGGDGAAPNCTPLGQACSATNDTCCSGACTSGSCQPPKCITQGAACSVDGQCCSGTCTGGTCATLNPTCETLGNACTNGSQCCSKLCVAGQCAQASYCGQAGDICTTGTDCCGGVCTVAPTKTFGTCSQPPATGAQCSMIDGTVCAGTAGTLLDGGIVTNDAGIPACGGACCSRSCAPWGPTGVLICQPASGCRPVGDICAVDSDCCGGPGLPGPIGAKNTTCNISPPNVLGVCANPNGCKPNGDICRLQTNSCNATDECCAGNVQQHDTCKQDLLGIPRCTNETCTPTGGGCATSADCCDLLPDGGVGPADGGAGGTPCVPNPSYVPDGGAPEFVCGATICVPVTGACTTNADCCPGNYCHFPAGSTKGSCTTLTPPQSDAGPPPDGGTLPDGAPLPDGSTPDAAPPPDSGPPCSLVGQVCTQSSDCCNSQAGIFCSSSGRCATP